MFQSNSFSLMFRDFRNLQNKNLLKLANWFGSHAAIEAISKLVLSAETTRRNPLKIIHPGGEEGVLPGKRLLRMCRLMGSHFHNWTDYNGVTFLLELPEWGRTFSGFLE